MNKKIKIAAALTALTLVGSGATVALTGCGKDNTQHTHTYSAWGYEGDEHWKKCPVDGVIDESTRAEHTFVDGACECGAPAKQVTITDGTAANAHGTISIDKTSVLSGARVTVTVIPAEGYQLSDLTVNGEGVSGAMTGNTYVFTPNADVTVVATFEKIASSSVNSKITGKKYGVDGNSIAAGTAVTLSAVGREDVTTEVVADGDGVAVKIPEIAGDDWTLKIEGYADKHLVIARDVEYNDDIALEYDLMENLKTVWGDGSDSVDLGKQNEGKITYVSGYYQWVSSKDAYDSVAITARAVKGGFRQGVFIRFKGESHDKDAYAMLEKENQDKVCWCGAGDGFKGKNIFSDWDDYIKPLDKDEYDLTLVRKGVKLYVFIDGEYKAEKTLPDEYAEKQCYVGLFCTDAEKMENKERTFAIGTYDDFFKTVTITDATAQDEKGSLALPADELKVGEQAEITITPEDGYILGTLKVNGKEYSDRVVNGKLTLTLVSPTVELKATFIQSAFTASNAVCPDGTYDLDSYIVNDKLVLGYKRYNAAGDAPSYGDLIGTGLDGITRYGGDFNGSSDTIAFKAAGVTNANCLFLDNGQYVDVAVKVPADAKQILVFTGTYDGGDRTITCSLYDDGGSCVGNGTFLHTRGDSPRADLVTFTVDSSKLDAQGENLTLRIGGNCSTTVAAIVVLGDKKPVTISASAADANGTVALDKQSYVTGDEVNVTLTPAANHRVKDLKVDGQSVLASITGNEYTFIALKDTAVVAEFEEIKEVDVTLNFAVKNFDGTDIELADGATVIFTDRDVQYTYTEGSEENFTKMYAGNYTVKSEGFFDTAVTVVEGSGNITVTLEKPIAVPSGNAGGAITVAQDKTISVKGNGISDRENNRKINAEYLLSQDKQNSTALTLTFTAKATMKDGRGGSDWAASRFGVQIGEGEIGFIVFPRYENSATAADVAKFIPGTALSLNPDSDHVSEKKWHGDDPDLAWLAQALYSENGVQFRVTRAAGVISIEVKNGDAWIALDTMGTKGETANVDDIGKLTIANTVKNQIKFTAGGDHWTFSDISVTIPDASKKASISASVHKPEGQETDLGEIETDIENYYEGDKAILTITAVKGYELEKLVIGEEEITTGWTKNGLVYTYVHTLAAGSTTVVAHIIETPTPKVVPNINVTGGKYGSTETPTITQGTKVTLKNAESELEYEGTVGADGKLTFEQEIYALEYEVSAQGYFDGKITITEDTETALELKLYIDTVDCEITVGETGDNAKFIAEGAKLTFVLGDDKKEVTVTDGKVKLTDVKTGSWATSAIFGDYEISLGTTDIGTSGAAIVTVDAAGMMWSKAEQPIASSNIVEGTVEIITNVAHHNKIILASEKEGGAMAFKFKLPESVDTTGDFRTVMSMPITFADNNNMVLVFFAEKSGETKTVKLGYTSVNGGEWWNDADRLNLSAQFDTFVNGGLWIVVDVNAKNSAVSTFVGATLETAVNANYNRTYKNNSKVLTAFEIGNGGYELNESNKNICVTFAYGETLSALNVGKGITLATVGAEVTVGGTDDKYTAEGATLVFSHTNGVFVTEGKVTNNKVTLADIPVGEYKVGAKVNGLIVDLGNITVAEDDTQKSIALEAKAVFDPKKEQDYAGYDLAEGTFEIITNATYHNKINFVQAGNGGALAFKFALPEGTDTSGDFKAITSMPLTYADGSMWIVLRLEKSGDNKIAKFGFTYVNGDEYWGKDGGGYLDLSAQWDTIVGGGLWVVVDIDAANGAIKTYTGANLADVADANYNRTVKSDNRTIVALEIGNAIEPANTNLRITVAYGETLDALKAAAADDQTSPEQELKA